MTNTSTENVEPSVENLSPHRRLSSLWQGYFVIATIMCAVLAVNQLFNLGFLIDKTILENNYQYALLGLLIPLSFIIFPARKGQTEGKVPWYDWALFAITVAVLSFFVYKSAEIQDKGWEQGAPDYVVVFCVMLWLLILEATRRAGGMPLFLIVTVISIYPIIAENVPDIISGQYRPFSEAAANHAMSNESILGIPMRALANLVIGFLIFGVALQKTGGGAFFINLAFSLLGHVRGGPAKVAIFASGLMGSMSGSVISNVVTTGVMTIPAMRKTGFSKSYAAGVETCASTGGVLMPPIMGATAFIIAVNLEVSYITIVVAAIIPSIFYFFALFVQIDAHAARAGMPGMPREELPSVKETLKGGWYYIFVFVLLIVMLIYMKQEAHAPFYATLLLIVINQVVSKERWDFVKLKEFVLDVGKLLVEIAAILAGVGLVVGAINMTGMQGPFSNSLVYAAGNNTLILLFMGALTCFIMGIGMTVTAAYVFLAAILAPALVNGGIDPLAAHLFIFYWGMVSYITPPVALGAYAAASVAGANAMRTGFEAMRLGSIIYFVPFFFVLDNAFILKASWTHIVLMTTTALVGITIIAGALQGYLIGLGDLTRHAFLQWPIRLLFFGAGFCLALPGGNLIPFTNIQLALIALAMAVPAAILVTLINRRSVAPAQ